MNRVLIYLNDSMKKFPGCGSCSACCNCGGCGTTRAIDLLLSAWCLFFLIIYGNTF